MNYFIHAVLFAVLLLLWQPVRAQLYQGKPLTKTYAVKELGSQVFSIVQDDRGVMYFAMGKGVVEYDGKYWREIPLPSEMTAYSLTKSKEGTIYVGGVDHFGYLSLSHSGKTVFEDLTRLLDKKIVVGGVFSVRNTERFVYFHTLTHIFRYEKKTKVIKVFKGKPNEFSLGDFVMEDTYYFSGLEKGLLTIENDEIVKAPHGDYFKNQEKTEFLFANADYENGSKLILGTRNSLHIYSITNTPPRTLPLQSGDFLKDNFLYACIRTIDGKYLLLGSLYKGGILIDNKGTLLQQYNDNTGLALNEILSAHQTTQQNTWLGLSNGITKTELGLDLMQWNNSGNYKGDMYFAHLEGNTLYALTSQDIAVIAPGKKVTFMKGGNAHIQKWGMTLFKLNGKSKTILAAGSTLYEIFEDHIAKIYSSNSKKYFVLQSARDRHRLITTESNTLLSFRYEHNKWIDEGTWSGIERDNIRKIVEAPDGILWLSAFTSGLVKVVPDPKNITKPKKVTYYGIEEGLPSLNRCAPFVYQDKILVGTKKGLYAYIPQKDRFEPYCGFGKQFCDGSTDVYHFAAKANNILIAPYKGTVSLIKKDLMGKTVIVTQPFKRIPKMRIERIEADSVGTIWIVGEEGIFRYDARKDTKNYAQSFNCLVRKIKLARDSVIYWGNKSEIMANKAAPTKLPYGFNNIKFEFAAPFFDQEEETLYSYHLEGNDTHWAEWATVTEKEYTNLWEGTYTFKVKAKNIYGIESSMALYTFSIQPPWYRTWWAFLTYMMALTLASVGAVKGYNYRLVRNKLSLEREVRERTLVIKQQNIELKKQKELSDLQANDLARINETKDKLFAVLGHDLRAPINSLAGLMELVSQKSISPQVLQLYTDKLKINVKQVHFTLNNLLFWAKGQMQGLVSKPQLFELNSMIENNLNLMQEPAFEKRITLINLAPQHVTVWADQRSSGYGFKKSA